MGDHEGANPESSESATPGWFAYKDEDGYWIESAGEKPCLSLWTPLRTVWERAIGAIKDNNGGIAYLRYAWIGDPIYDYIYIPPPAAYLLNPTNSEYLFLQRLRYIKQNGAAYLVFPSLRSTRFEHSLGAMELARRITDSLFKSSPTDIVKEFSTKVRYEFAMGPDPKRNGNDSPWLASFRVLADPEPQYKQTGDQGENHKTIQHKEEWDEEKWDARFDGWVTKQTALFGLVSPLRVGKLPEGEKHVVSKLAALHFFKLTACLVALLHDVGHLPFSHALEDPLENLLLKNRAQIIAFPMKEVSGKKIHERISLEIIRRGERWFASKAWRDAVLLSLLAEGKDAKWDPHERGWVDSSLFTTLHSMVSSEVDVDRIDFVARDGYESGAAIGKFDLSRILRSAVLYYRDKLENGPDGEIRSSFGISFRDHCLGDLEALLFERFKLYKNISYHHKVEFYDAAVGILLAMAESLEPKLLKNAFQKPQAPLEDADQRRLKAEQIGNYPFFLWKDCQDCVKCFQPQFLVWARRDVAVPTFYDDGFVVNQIREADLVRKPCQTLREAFLLRRAFSVSLWKRAGDFETIRQEFAKRVADFLKREQLVATTPSPGGIQKLLINLPYDTESRQVMHWASGKFDQKFTERVLKLREGIRRIKGIMEAKQNGLLEALADENNNTFLQLLADNDTDTFLKWLEDCCTVVTGTSSTLFGDLAGLRIMAGTDAPPIEILEASSALNALRHVPTEIAYYVFVVGPKLELVSLLSQEIRDRFKKFIVDFIFYDSLNATIGDFLEMSKDEVKLLWGVKVGPDYPRRLFEVLVRRFRN